MSSRSLSRPALAARLSTLQDVLDALEDQAVRTGKPFDLATSAVYSQLQIAHAELRQHDADEQQREFMEAVRSAAYGDLGLPADALAHPEYPEDRYSADFGDALSQRDGGL